MCGIAGSFGENDPSPERVRRTLDLMRQRGPDDSGHRRTELGETPLHLLFRRLAILDLDPRSGQPFDFEHLTLIYNGEIYNYLELRQELERLGHRFRTDSDTEVLIQAWARWGAGALDRLEGMWAFALLDRNANQLYLSRDRFGEKPLYFWRHEKTLYFGSEVKFLASLAGTRPTVDAEQIRRYLVLGYKSLYKRPRGWFNEIDEVPAGCLVTISPDGGSLTNAYWQLLYAPRAMTLQDAEEGARSRLETSLKIRLRADVPVAFCLSGGVDSTTLAGIAAKRLGQPLHAFSIIDSDERYDELDNIEATVAHLGCDSHKVRTSTEGFFDRLAGLVTYHDGPVATLTYYLHEFLSEAISKAGYKVAISGTAADELYTGYYDHYAFWLAEMAGRPDFDQLVADWRESYGAFVRNPKLQDPLTFHRDPSERGHIYLDAEYFASFLVEPFDEGFEESHYTDNLLRNRMANELFHEATPVILKEDDLNSMRHSVENRSPYLDRHLAEFLFTVPPEHLIQDGYAKWLLRAAAKDVVPDSVRLDKRKRGFNASIDSLVNRSNPETRARLLDDSPIFDVVKRDRIAPFLEGSMQDNSLSKFLFSFCSAKVFLEHYRDWQP